MMDTASSTVSLLRRIGATLVSPTAARITSYALAVVLYSVLAATVERVPTIDAILRKLVEETQNGHVWENFAATGIRFGVVVLISIAVGTAIGLASGLSRLVRAAIGDLLIVALTIPAVIWTFLAVLWFGLGDRTVLIVGVLAATPFVAVNVSKGVRTVPRDLVDMSMAYGVPFVDRLRHLILPAVMGYVVAGVRLAIIIGWGSVLLAEWFAASNGVGFRSRYWYDGNQFAGFVGWFLLFIAFIVALDRLILDRLLQRAFKWRIVAGASMGAV